MVVIAHSRGNFLVAERHFERALEINPSYTEAALNPDESRQLILDTAESRWAGVCRSAS